jgi:hypothetical protein
MLNNIVLKAKKEIKTVSMQNKYEVNFVMIDPNKNEI